MNMEEASSSKFRAVVFLLFLQFAAHFSAAGGANTVLLGPENQDVHAPRGSEWMFSCTGLYAGDDTAWFIETAEKSSALTLQFVDRWQSELNGRQISRTVIHHSGVNATAIVTVRALADNNGIKLKCQVGDSMMIVSYTATLVVYDHPMAPKVVNVSTIDVQSVNVSWFAIPKNPEIDVNFTLTVENLNSTASNKQTLIVKESYYVYNASNDASPCDIYMFYVTATNGAGTSDPSMPVIMMLSSLPNMKPVNDSLTHTISKIEKEISVNIAFDAANACMEYPVTHYHVLASTSPNESPVVIATGKASDFKDNRIEFKLSDSVQENTLYTYHILATNEVGNASSLSKEYYTSDVHTVNAEEGDNQTLGIECHFIRGSDAHGCLVVFVSDSKNTSFMIYRDNANDSVAIEILNMDDGVCYHDVYGFDIESDNNISSLAVPGMLSMSCSSPTPPTPVVRPAPNGPFSQNTIIICAAVAAGVVLLLICALVVLGIIVVCYCRHTKTKGTWDVNVSEKDPGPFTRNTYNVIVSSSSPSSNYSPPYLESPSSSLAPDFHRQETQETCIDSSSSLSDPQSSDSPDSHEHNSSIDSTVQLPDSHVSTSHSQGSNSQSNHEHHSCIESPPDTQAPMYAELTEFTGTRSSRLHSQTPPPIRRSLSVRVSLPSPFHQEGPSTCDDSPSQDATNVYDMPDKVRPRQDTTYSLLDHKTPQHSIGERASSAMEITEATYSELADVTDSGDSRGQSPSMVPRNSELVRHSSLSTHRDEMYSQINQTPVYAVLENSSSPEPPPLPPPLTSSLITPLTTPLPTPEHELNDAPPLYCEINELPTSLASTVDAHDYTDALNNDIPGAGTDVL